MPKVNIVIEVDEDIEPDFRLNLANWLDDFFGDDSEWIGKVKVLPKEE